jgi:hypothetical protein
VANGELRLFGGAQYHRALEEYRLAVLSVRCPAVRQEEIVNACGMDEVHDGVNYSRTACVIAVAKARDAFEPFLHQLGFRLSHILRRLLPISMYLLQREGRFLNGNDLFIKRIGSAFHSFVDKTVRDCQQKCLDDLHSTTEFVSWSLHSGNKAGLRAVLGGGSRSSSSAAAAAPSAPGAASSSTALVAADGSAAPGRVMELIENGLWTRKLSGVTQDLVGVLVEQIFDGIRDYLVTSSELKFNCFLLMPCIQAFPARLREEIELAMEEDIDSIFDVAAVRDALLQRRAKLEAELESMSRIQSQFNAIHAQLCRLTGNGAETGVKAPREREKGERREREREPLHQRN